MITSKDLTVRWVIRKDLEKILSIERESPEPSWKEEDFLLALRQRNVIGVVAELNFEVVGFQLYKLKPLHFEVIKMTVSSEFSKQGIGGFMVHRLKEKLGALLIHKLAIVFKVRETNLQIQLFLQGRGFICDKIVKGYYEPTTSEAMYRMIYSISEAFEYED